ncbi:hypothetical protein OG474_45475 [Kribbella sp. NBC_01505]|uniref:hypothetical protein n=1 Tax=Kribbella sp. NBC_01505 TaxID=2903580 RepID=UPI003870C6D8
MAVTSAGSKGPIISMLGLPGTGKSTQSRLLSEAVEGSLIVSVPLLRKGNPGLLDRLSQRARHELDGLAAQAAAARDLGQLAPRAFDHAVIELVTTSDAPLTILDGHPKGLLQSQLLLADPTTASRLVVFEFDLGGDSEARSIDRQRSRALSKNQPAGPEDLLRFQGKLATFRTHTLAGLIHLRATAAVHRLDATDDQDSLHRRILELITKECADDRR